MTWIDRRLWIIPLGAFVAGLSALATWASVARTPILLAKGDAERRVAVYNSLTGTSAGLLGFTLAAVAIIAAFADRSASSNTHRARQQIVILLLITSFFLLVILICATVGIALDQATSGSEALESILGASLFASSLGLLIGGGAFALSVLEVRP